MIKVYQTKYGKKDGNCFQACVASVMEMKLDDVPDFCNIYSEDTWYIEFAKWLEQFNLSSVMINVTKSMIESSDLFDVCCKGYHIAGVSTSHDTKHAIVIKDGDMVFNPNINDKKEYTTKDIEDVQVFVCQDASQVKGDNNE